MDAVAAYFVLLYEWLPIPLANHWNAMTTAERAEAESRSFLAYEIMTALRERP